MDHELHGLHERKEEKKIIHKELSYEIIGAALEVHKHLGTGFTENIYEEAFCLELTSRGIPFQRQLSVPVSYKGHEVGKYQIDLMIDEKIVVELKAISDLIDTFEYQLHA